MVERFVGTFGTRKPMVFHETLDFHGVRIHKQQRLHALGFCAPYTFIWAAGRLAGAHEQARRLGAKTMEEPIFIDFLN